MKKVFKITGIVLGSIVALALLIVGIMLIYSKTYKVKVDAEHENNTEYIQAYGRGLYTPNGKEIILQGTNFGGYFVNEGWLMPYAIYEDTRKESEPDQPQYVDDTGNEAVSQDEFLTALKNNPNNFTEDQINTILDTYYTNWLCEDDVENVMDLGLNCIRIPFGYRMLMNYDLKTDEYSFKDEEEAFKYLDRVLTWVKNVNEKNPDKDPIYVVLDLHTTPHSHNGYEHSGAMEYASGRACTNYIGFWDNDTAVESIVELWDKISVHYTVKEAELGKLIAMYDIFNEPVNKNYSGDKQVWDVMDKVYDAIRENNDKHVICLEGCWSFLALPNPAKYGWENVCYSYHWYNFVNLPWDLFYAYQDITNMFTNYDVPVYQGEFTFFGSEEAWEKGLALFNERHYSWTTWTYKKVVDGWWDDSWAIYGLNMIEDTKDTEGVYHCDDTNFYKRRVNVSTATYDEIIEALSVENLKTEGNTNLVEKIVFKDSTSVTEVNHVTIKVLAEFIKKQKENK